MSWYAILLSHTLHEVYKGQESHFAHYFKCCEEFNSPVLQPR